MVNGKKLVNFETSLGNEIISEMLRQESDKEYIQQLEREVKYLRKLVDIYESDD